MSVPQTAVPPQSDRCVGGTALSPGTSTPGRAVDSPGSSAAPAPAMPVPGVGAQTPEACLLATSTAPTLQGWWVGLPAGPGLPSPEPAGTITLQICLYCGTRFYVARKCPNCGWNT